MSPPHSSPAESKYIIESIAVREFFKDYGEQLCLRLVNSEKSLGRSTIRERSVNRPALAVTGYFKYFANKRIQLFGAGEMGFFREQSSVRRKNVMETMALTTGNFDSAFNWQTLFAINVKFFTAV